MGRKWEFRGGEPGGHATPLVATRLRSMHHHPGLSNQSRGLKSLSTHLSNRSSSCATEAAAWSCLAALLLPPPPALAARASPAIREISSAVDDSVTSCRLIRGRPAALPLCFSGRSVIAS